MDVSRAADESAFLRTAKSCGPGASMVGVKLRGSVHEVMVTKKPDHQGEHEVNRNTIACGNAGCPGATVVTNARAYYSTRAAAGATGTRHSPLPLLGQRIQAQLGRIASRERKVISVVGWAKPTGRANARPMTGSACPPRSRMVGTAQERLWPSLRLLSRPVIEPGSAAHRQETLHRVRDTSSLHSRQRTQRRFLLDRHHAPDYASWVG
jgi:hypothetical protein